MARAVRLFVTMIALLLAARAAADACVQIDTERDTLQEPERAAARTLFMRALEVNGQPVSTARGGTPCSTVYWLYNVRLGSSVSSVVAGPQGTRTATARVIEDLPNVYDQMVRSLLSGVPMTNSSGALTRSNVTAAQAAPRRAEADSLWYARVGYGLTAGGGSTAGPAIGFGYRHELDQLGIDFSFVNLTFAHSDSTTGSGNASISGSWARLLAYFFVNPEGNSTVYAGGGLSWGGSAVSSGGGTYSGSGLQGELSLGVELLRASSIRLFVQADATLPFYRSTADFGGVTGASGSRYTPTFVIAFGGGFGRSNVARVNVIP